MKPRPDSPLLKLGMEKAPPIVTTAVLLDAKTHLGKGKAMEPGARVTAKDIEAMLKAQGLGRRGLLLRGNASRLFPSAKQRAGHFAQLRFGDIASHHQRRRATPP